MKTAVTFALLFYTFAFVRTAARLPDDKIEFNDDDFEILEEDSDAPFELDDQGDERGLLDDSKVILRDRGDHIIIEKAGESARFFRENPPMSESSGAPRSGELPYYQFSLDENYQGAVYDDRRVEIVNSQMVSMVQRYIRGRSMLRQSQQPQVMIFPKGGRLGCLRPVLITWGYYSDGSCWRPVCRPDNRKTTSSRKPMTSKTTTRSTRKTTTKKIATRTTTPTTTTRCVKLRRVCYYKDSTAPGWYADDTLGANNGCDPALEDCAIVGASSGNPLETTSEVILTTP